MPVYATLTPKNGDPDLYIYIIKNFSEPKYEWNKYPEKEYPLFQSHASFGSDQIYLSPNDTTFSKKCGSSCILLLEVKNLFG